MTWVVAYDISENRNRVRVAKLLVANGIRIQKSVFLLEASRAQVKNLTQQLAAEINLDTDCVCAWPLAEAWQGNQHVFPKDAEPLRETFLIA